MSERVSEDFQEGGVENGMVIHTDCGKHIHVLTAGEEFSDQELLSSCDLYEKDYGAVAVQLLEFKTSFLEAVEELHIRRNAEIQFEEQVSKLVLEKQELDWQKESLQHKIDTLMKEHTDYVSALNKQFQVTIRGFEGEKGKYQLTTELKDKEISSLKKELKSLQLSKYSLQKKLSEVEQKLNLQTQSKDNHLSKLSEVEKRFGIVSRQFVTVKQVHETLEQNVEEAIGLNKRLSAVNKKQEVETKDLKQEVEKLNRELSKCRVLVACKPGEEILNHTLKEQLIQLQQKLRVQMVLNKKLSEEVSSTQAEKQEVMRCLQHAQQLLHMQTKAVSRVELELNALRQEYQVLKREHELLQAKTREKEEGFVSVVEEKTKLKTNQEGTEPDKMSKMALNVNTASMDLEKQLTVDTQEIHASGDGMTENITVLNEDKGHDCSHHNKELNTKHSYLQTHESEPKMVENEEADNSTDSGPAGPQRIVREGPLPADYCAAIIPQTACVYPVGLSDTGGPEESGCPVDLAGTGLQKQGSRSVLAWLPISDPPPAVAGDTVDAMDLGFTPSTAFSTNCTGTSGPQPEDDHVGILPGAHNQLLDIDEKGKKEHSPKKLFKIKEQSGDFRSEGFVEFAEVQWHPDEVYELDRKSSDGVSQNNNISSSQSSSLTVHHPMETNSDGFLNEVSSEKSLDKLKLSPVSKYSCSGSEIEMLDTREASGVNDPKRNNSLDVAEISKPLDDTEISADVSISSSQEQIKPQRHVGVPRSFSNPTRGPKEMPTHKEVEQNAEHQHSAKHDCHISTDSSSVPPNSDTQATKELVDHLKRELNDVSSTSLLVNKRLRRSFDLHLFDKNKTNPQTQNWDAFVNSLQENQCRNNIHLRSPLSMEYRERSGGMFLCQNQQLSLPAFRTAPQKDEAKAKDSLTIKRPTGVFNTSHIQTCRKRRDWDSVMQTLHEISAEHKSTVPIPFSEKPANLCDSSFTSMQPPDARSTASHVKKSATSCSEESHLYGNGVSTTCPKQEKPFLQNS